MDAGAKAALEAAVGGKVSDARPVGGGDINRADAVTLADGRRLFVKTNARAPTGMFAAEARGLGWLAEARALRVPEVIAHGAGFLALELVVAAPPARDFDERLGRGLAALHRHGASRFGLDHDNFIGRLPQDNASLAEAGWAAFYRARRLEPQLRRAVDEGLASSRMRRGFERLFAALADLVGPEEPPARLHGDLWGGNLLCDETGAPCLCDRRPSTAATCRTRSGDDAALRPLRALSCTFAAYEEAWPSRLATRRARAASISSAPLMVHVNLFGGGYVGQVEAMLDRLV